MTDHSNSQNWQEAKREVRQCLIAGTRSTNGLVFYSAIPETVTAMEITAYGGILATILGEISREEEHAGRGMLSVVVVRKDTLMPGSGFFDLARELGRDVGDEDTFWLAEWERVRTYWQAKSM